MSNPIQNSYIQFHNAPFPEGVKIKNNSVYKNYGVLSIHANNVPITKKPIFFHFKMDCSSSMSERCKDGRTKMQHTQHTLTNMLYFFAKNKDATIFVQVNAFDIFIHPIIPVTQVTEENIDSLVAAIDKMRSLQNTNIELALQDSDTEIQQYMSDHPGHDVSHIFMTDGKPTDGNMSSDYLSTLVSDKCSNTFIAFGLEHSAIMMQKLGRANKNSSNWLIDQLENAGLVYGEILNNELYRAFDNAEIKTKNCLVYNYINGEFVDNLYIGNLCSESKKMYHVLGMNDGSEFKIFISVIESQSGIFVLSETNYREENDFTEQIFRLRTQQLMFEAKSVKPDAFYPKHCLLKRQKALPNPHVCLKTCIDKDMEPMGGVYTEPTMGDVTPALQQFKKHLTDFFEIMSSYMKAHNKEEDTLMKRLTDDIYFTIRTFGTQRQEMCISARETSQGRQQCYNVVDFGLNELDKLKLPPVPILKYTTSRSRTNIDSQTPSIMALMRTCSAPVRNLDEL